MEDCIVKKLIMGASISAIALAGGAALAFAGVSHGPGHGRGGPGAHAAHMLQMADADNDSVLTSAEFDAHRAQMFARMDADSNGELTRDEMRQAHAQMRQNRAARLDANADGSISRDEFLAPAIARFDRLDANNDGELSADERPEPRHQGARHEGRQEGRHGGHRGRGLRMMDTDNSGTISRAEFDAAGAQMFARVDANNDGRITQEEAAAPPPPPAEQ